MALGNYGGYAAYLYNQQQLAMRKQHKENYDLIVIGGGINGLGIAREAQMRGLDVCVVEKDDIGAGTSAASTRLIHGGLRYLANIKGIPEEFLKHPTFATVAKGLNGSAKLVAESLFERAYLLRNAPHLVHPIDLVIPTQTKQGFQDSRLEHHKKDKLKEAVHNHKEVALGLWFYDACSRLIKDQLEGSNAFEPAQFKEKYKFDLDSYGSTGGLSYQDAQVELPERLCLENAIDAVEKGADIKTHTEAKALLLDTKTPAFRKKWPWGKEYSTNVRVTGIEIQDNLHPQESHELIYAPIVINATGSQVDLFNALPRRWKQDDGKFTGPVTTKGGFANVMGGTKGTHIIVKRESFKDVAPAKHGYYAQASAEGRPFFILPWRKSPNSNDSDNDLFLIGTTDTEYKGNLDRIVPTKIDVDYLLAETNRLLAFQHSSSRLTSKDVLYAYAGVRPLPAEKGKSPGQKTREHIIADHVKEKPYPSYPGKNKDQVFGLLSIIGGKLTTYRSLGEETVDYIYNNYRDTMDKPDGRQVAIVKEKESPTKQGPRSALPGAKGIYDPACAGAPWEQFKNFKDENVVLIRASQPELSIATANQLLDLYGIRYTRIMAMINPNSDYWQRDHFQDFIQSIAGKIEPPSEDLAGSQPTLDTTKNAIIQEWRKPLVEGSPCIGAQVVYAIENEFAKTLPDIMRRLGANWHEDLGVAESRKAAEIAAPYLGWSQARTEAEIGKYEQEVNERFKGWERTQ